MFLQEPVRHTLVLADLCRSNRLFYNRYLHRDRERETETFRLCRASGNTITPFGKRKKKQGVVLSCFEDVIMARVQQQQQIHSIVPYSDSKLTHLLQHYLNGGAPMLMIATVVPTDQGCDRVFEETGPPATSTLRVAQMFSQLHWYPNSNRIQSPGAPLLAQCCQQCKWLRDTGHYDSNDEIT